VGSVPVVGAAAAAVVQERFNLKMMFSTKALKSKEGSIATKKGDVVTCVASDWESRGEWLQVMTQDGTNGWVMSSHVKRI
jgi:hypothetical protein